MKNIERLKSLSNWDTAVVIFLISNGQLKISDCAKECKCCDMSDGWCVSQIGEWLDREESNAEESFAWHRNRKTLGFGNSYTSDHTERAEGFNACKKMVEAKAFEREQSYRGKMQFARDDKTRNEMYGSARACEGLANDVRAMKYEG